MPLGSRAEMNYERGCIVPGSKQRHAIEIFSCWRCAALDRQHPTFLLLKRHSCDFNAKFFCSDGTVLDMYVVISAMFRTNMIGQWNASKISSSNPATIKKDSTRSIHSLDCSAKTTPQSQHWAALATHPTPPSVTSVSAHQHLLFGSQATTFLNQRFRFWHRILSES